ncbi:hypothetical protein JCM3775_001773 [Rhodotorula graminis]
MEPFRPFRPNDVRHRRFCCCVPVRWGVLALALVGATLAACLGIAAIQRLFSPDINPWRAWLEVASIVLWFSLVVLCLYGWAGGISQKREWVEWFYELVWWHLWFNIAVGIYLLVVLALPTSKSLSAQICSKLALDKLDAELLVDFTADAASTVSLECFAGVRMGLILLDLAWTIAILIQLWLCLVIGHYLDELADREAAERFGVDIENPNPPYVFVPGDDAQEMRMIATMEERTASRKARAF